MMRRLTDQRGMVLPMALGIMLVVGILTGLAIGFHFAGPFGRTFAMADPDGYRVTIYERDQPLFWPPRPR